MELTALNRDFAICKLNVHARVELTGEFVFFARTDEEVSLVCESSQAPEDAIAVEREYKGLKICGELDFSLVGVIAGIARALTEENIPVFAVSTFQTDYFFIKAERFERACAVLRGRGYGVG